MKRILLVVLSLLVLQGLHAQENRLAPYQPNTAEIYHQLEELGFLGTALYLAAHPDDENTRLISWLANKKMARTAYLSLTRGDGGQNLIGPELREQLGIIRSQELLEARYRDGGEQFFTRANDFGYSKHPDETLKIWNKKEVLNDVVQIIRQFKPDVIINRFNHRTPGTTHGHHTSSAMLSLEAFDLVSDPNYKIAGTQPWNPERIFFNTSWWFYGSEEAFEKADKTNLLEIDAGSYYDYLGLSNNEIAALSRSEHKSQGFGSSGSRGKQIEYIEFLKGSFPEDKTDLFSGINTTWTRVQGGEKVIPVLQKLLKNYDFKNPTNSINDLFNLRKTINALPDGHWKTIKSADLDEIILNVIGFYTEASVSESQLTAQSTSKVMLELTNRSEERIKVRLKDQPYINIDQKTWDIPATESQRVALSLKIPENAPATTPYYLKDPGSLGMYTVTEKSLIGKPELEAAYQVQLTVMIDNQPIDMSLPIIHKRTDPVRGEVNEPLHIVPAVSIHIQDPVYIFNANETKNIKVIARAFEPLDHLKLSLKIPDGWTLTGDEALTINLEKGQQVVQTFSLTAPRIQSEAYISAFAEVNGKIYDEEVITIDYPHIPNQQLTWNASAKVVNPNLKNNAKKVAYINGAGDEVATAIEAMGSLVNRYEPGDIPSDLSSYDAVVIGIRAFNVAPQEMANLQNRFTDYVNKGGTLIMQYNTSRGIASDELGPLEISLSRKRVTDEYAAVTFLAEKHPVLQSPNIINSDDFNGWIQERGLYFPDSWDPAFTPILGMNDGGESMTKGSLIVAPYGKGHVVYTGLSFFRELPAGVSGAYRLFANLLSLGKNDLSKTTTDGN